MTAINLPHGIFRRPIIQDDAAQENTEITRSDNAHMQVKSISDVVCDELHFRPLVPAVQSRRTASTKMPTILRTGDMSYI